MQKVLFLFASLFLLSWQTSAQTVTITGQVLDKQAKMSLPGVYVIEKGTNNGTVTDFDGNYTLSVESPANKVLVFSYIGYKDYEVTIGSQTEVNVELEEDLMELSEVIVTAMNIKQNKRDLNYAAQDIKSSDIAESQQQNVVNSLQGKVAGVQITSSSGSPGSSSSIIIRGGASISEGRSNEPLFVIDGVIMDNSTFQGSGNRGMDINPDDIESMTVLKGPAAAALYGMDAGNGAIIITTKSAKAGKASVNFSTTLAVDRMFKTHEQQTTYSRGIRGVRDNETSLMWGPAYTAGEVKYDNIGEFFQTGVQQKYDLGISGGTDKTNYYLSLSNNNQTGIVPGEKYNRFNFLIKGSTKIRDNLSVTGSVNSSMSQNTRGRSGSMYNTFLWPTDDNMKEYLNPDGSKRWLFPDKDPDQNPENPYWYVNNNMPFYDVNRNLSQVFFDWDVIESFKITYRIGMDMSNQYYRSVTVPESAGTYSDGRIYESEKAKQRITSTLIASFSKIVNEDWDIYAMVGYNVDMAKARVITYQGTDFLIPSLISINNVKNEERPIQQNTRIRSLGVFGDFRLNYKGYASIGITARNDWTSTLHPDRNSFFYPSVSLGFTFTELMGNRTSSFLSFGKIRGSWADSGKGAPAEVLGVVLEQYPGLGVGYKHDYYAGNPYIKPEAVQATEIGVNLALYEGKINFDAAYYHQKSIDMIISNRISTASGWVIQYFNTGDMVNQGIEIVIDSKVMDKGDFTWNLLANFSRNRSKLTSLPYYISRLPVTRGQIINEARPIALIDQPLFAIEGTSYLRNDNGDIVLNQYGYPRWGTYVKDADGNYVLNSDGTIKVSQEKVYLGNREPDWMLGITNTLNYRKFSLSFLFDIRKGGDVINATRSIMMSRGLPIMLDEERNKTYTFNGVVEVPNVEDGTVAFEENNKEVVLGYDYFRFNYRAVGENFVEDGSWLKLRYIALTYDMTSIGERIGIKNLQATLTGRNLFMLSKYSGGDPENDYDGSAVGGAGTVGLDYFNVPTTQGITFGLKATF
ncbi:MAG: SusC/RagA family TonB-linked outer membrane protein [Bacteroidota bacterium]